MSTCSLHRQPRYYPPWTRSANRTADPGDHARRRSLQRTHAVDQRHGSHQHGGDTAPRNPLGKLPGSVWSIPSQPLTVPPHSAWTISPRSRWNCRGGSSWAGHRRRAWAGSVRRHRHGDVDGADADYHGRCGPGRCAICPHGQRRRRRPRLHESHVRRYAAWWSMISGTSPTSASRCTRASRPLSPRSARRCSTRRRSACQRSGQ